MERGEKRDAQRVPGSRGGKTQDSQVGHGLEKDNLGSVRFYSGHRAGQTAQKQEQERER